MFIHDRTSLRLRIIAKSAIIGQISWEAPTHLPENQCNWKTNSIMNMKVSDIIQYYAYKTLDILD